MLFYTMSRFRTGSFGYVMGCLGLIGLLTLSGCSDGVPKVPTVPAHGTVTYKGQPLDGAQVSFISKEKETGKSANAVTDTQGKFELHTYLVGSKQASGAVPGDYIVTVQKREGGMAGATDEAAGMKSMMMSGDPTAKKEGGQGMMPDVKLLTPAKYADASKPELTATVKPSGDNSFTFDLVD